MLAQYSLQNTFTTYLALSLHLPCEDYTIALHEESEKVFCIMSQWVLLLLPMRVCPHTFVDRNDKFKNELISYG